MRSTEMSQQRSFSQALKRHMQDIVLAMHFIYPVKSESHETLIAGKSRYCQDTSKMNELLQSAREHDVACTGVQ